MRSLVVVPTYNEFANLARLAEQVLGQDGFEILVVDDNSSDGTGRLAEQLRARYPDALHVIHRPAKLGLGSAYVAGFRFALCQGYDDVFQMDADFSHNPADLARLRQELVAGADLAIGSRYYDGGGTRNWPWARRLLSRFGSTYARLILGVAVQDLTSGFKGWRRETLAALDLWSIRSNGYSFQIEMTYRAHRLGARIVEIPIIFEERRLGRSKLSRRIVLEAIWMVWKLRLDPPPETPADFERSSPIAGEGYAEILEEGYRERWNGS